MSDRLDTTSAQTARSWYRSAVPSERRLAGAMAALVSVLVVVAVFPNRPPAERELLGVGTTSSTLPGALGSAATGGGAPIPTVDGDAAPVTSDGASLAGPRTPGTTTPAANGGDPSSPTPQIQRTASDRGVTADEIKLGFTVFDVGGVQNAGVGLPNIRHDIPEVIDALVADANRRGGVHGRAIVPVTKYIDVVSVEDQKAKCLEFANTDKVFAVIDTFGFIYRSTRDCVAQDNETPLVTSLAGSRDELQAHYPYQVSSTADDNVIAKNWVYAAKADGFFDRAKGFTKLGIFSDNCDRKVIDDPDIGLKKYLREIGITKWSEYIGDCDVSAFQRSGSQAVVQHVTDGVSHVLHITPGVAISGYLRVAEAQGYHPEYFVSDYLGLTSDGIVIDFEPAQWDGVRAATATFNGETAIGHTVNANAQRCSKALETAGLPPIDDYSEDFEAIYLCESLEIFLAAAHIAPVNLTRLDWGSAVPMIGEFPSAWVQRAIFEPGVFAAGGRTLAVVEWSGECTCYRQVLGHQELAWPIDR